MLLNHSVPAPDLLAFLAAHRLPDLPADPEYLIALSAGAEWRADIRQNGERVLVAVLIDTCANQSDAGEFLVLATRDNPVANGPFLAALAALEAQAVKGPRSVIEIGLTQPIMAQRAMLVARGYAVAYALHNMNQPCPAQADPVILREGWSWAEITDANRRDLFDLLHDAFAGIPARISRSGTASKDASPPPTGSRPCC